MENTTKLFNALSNDVRLKIMILLYQGELCVCQIEEILKINQTMASRHLNVLKYSGLVKGRREGLWIYYSIVMPTDKIGKTIFSCFNELVTKYPDLKVTKKTMKSCMDKISKKCK